jgi:hypothetical protein
MGSYQGWVSSALTQPPALHCQRRPEPVKETRLDRTRTASRQPAAPPARRRTRAAAATQRTPARHRPEPGQTARRPRPHRPLNRQAITGTGGLPAGTGQGVARSANRRRRRGAPLTRAGRPPDNRAPDQGAPTRTRPATRNQRPTRPKARHHPAKHQARQPAPGSGVRPESGAPTRRTGH